MQLVFLKFELDIKDNESDAVCMSIKADRCLEKYECNHM